MIGKIKYEVAHLHREIGTGKIPSGEEITFGVSLPNHVPYVENKATGGTYFLGWHDILSLADQAGITNPKPQS